MTNFFALIRGDIVPVRRLPLTRDLQTDLTELFRQQRNAFLSESRERIAFEPGFRPDDGQLMFVADYHLPDDIETALTDPTALEPLVIDSAEPPQISGIIAFDSESREVLFQSFDRRRVLSTRRFTLLLSNDTFRRLDEPGLTLDSKLVAAIVSSRLYFESYFFANRVLDLTDYYREATDEDIEEFCNLPLFDVAELEVVRNNADSWVRRKITSILASPVLAQQTARAIQHAAREFDLNLAITRRGGHERLAVPDNKSELKTLLRFVEEDYFFSVLTRSKYLTNSKRRVG